MKKKFLKKLADPLAVLSDGKGFSLFELIVTMFLMSLLGVLVVSALIFVTNASAEKLEKTRRLNEITLALDTFKGDLELSGASLQLDSNLSVTELTLVRSITDTAYYALSNGRFYRNNLALSHERYFIDSISVAPLFTGDLTYRALALSLHYKYGDETYVQKTVAVIATNSQN